MRKLIFTGLILLLSGTAPYAQTDTKTENKAVAVFRFKAQNDMFYRQGNEDEFKRLYDFVDRHKTEITGGQMPVHVNGYCTSYESLSQNRKVAAIRSNRVKSELITKKGLKEEHFITANHAEKYEGKKDDIVSVSFHVETRRAASPPPQAEPKPQPDPVETWPAASPPQQAQAQAQAVPAEAEAEVPARVETRHATSLQEQAISLRTNLLLWAIATPNLGLEWKPSPNIGILINGAYSHWIWNSEDKQHRTWLIQPEIRYYFSGWFVGVEAHAAQFNFKFNDTGYQGDALGGGLTGGYRLQLSKCLDMDFSLGLGYSQVKYDTYYRSNGYMVKKENKVEKNSFTPTQAGVSLIFKL